MLPELIRRLTSDTAGAAGLHDRGVLRPGMKADVNVIDWEKLGAGSPYVVNDLPAGGKRLLQKVTGYDATIVSGRVTFRDGQATGALPGKLVRGSTGRTGGLVTARQPSRIDSGGRLPDPGRSVRRQCSRAGQTASAIRFASIVRRAASRRSSNFASRRCGLGWVSFSASPGRFCEPAQPCAAMSKMMPDRSVCLTS